MAVARFRPLIPLLALVALGLPADAADPVSCATQCMSAGAPSCSPVEFTGGSPRLQAKPFLNLVDINLGCLAGSGGP